MKEKICLFCGLPRQFRAFIVNRRAGRTIAANCHKCAKLPKSARRFLKYRFIDVLEKQTKAMRARLSGAVCVVPFCKADIIRRDAVNGIIKCYLCGKELTYKRATLDHVQPLSRCGAHSPENVKICCEPCNTAKENKTLAEYLAENIE